jgi:hypothetical protein
VSSTKSLTSSRSTPAITPSIASGASGEQGGESDPIDGISDYEGQPAMEVDNENNGGGTKAGGSKVSQSLPCL